MNELARELLGGFVEADRAIKKYVEEVLDGDESKMYDAEGHLNMDHYAKALRYAGFFDEDE
ncbi:hypothetical protein K1U80_005121 [Escherichia coli]|nr:hypothetical protein [Escherichia coli]